MVVRRTRWYGGHVFGSFGLELYASPMTDHVIVCEDEDGGTKPWTVTNHPRWEPLLTDPITDARLVWLESYADRIDNLTTPAPLALRLDFPAGTVRMIAAMEMDDGRWWLCADEVIVVFNDDFATSIGYLAHG